MTQTQKIILTILSVLVTCILGLFVILFVGMLSAPNAAKEDERIATSPTTTVTNIPSILPTSGATPFRTIAPTRPAECDANRWAVIPTKVYTLPAAGGFKILLVSLAVQNNGSVASQIVAEPGTFFVTTEGGFKYFPSSIGFISQDSPPVVEGNSTISAWNFLTLSEPIPPGFAARGDIALMGNLDVFLFVSKVAESQQHFVLTIPSIQVNCIGPDGQQTKEDTGIITLNLDRDVRQVLYPTGRPKTDFINLTQPIDIPSKGTLQFLSIQRILAPRQIPTLQVNGAPITTATPPPGELLEMRFRFTNASAGYAAAGDVQGYLIGDDGLVRWPCQQFLYSAGPGQSSESTLCFNIGTRARNFKLVLKDAKGNLKVYNLPEGY